jgi:hypothetical protein
MSPFNLCKSLERAAARLGDSQAAGGRRRRSDRGASRLEPELTRYLETLLHAHERPRMSALMNDLEAFCAGREGLRCPARATVYKFIDRCPGEEIEMAELPPEVQRVLYNIDSGARVPLRQLAFYCINYGDQRAMSFAAALPWLPLRQAYCMRGWRKRSKGVLEAILRARAIS